MHFYVVFAQLGSHLHVFLHTIRAVGLQKVTRCIGDAPICAQLACIFTWYSHSGEANRMYFHIRFAQLVSKKSPVV